MKLYVLSRYLGSFPSLGYALIYLSLIPIFAGIYCYLPNQFYHSTIQYEYQIEQIFERSKNTLFTIIKNDFATKYCADCKAGQEPEAIIKDWSIKLSKLDNFKLSDNQCSFDLIVFATRPTPTEKVKKKRQKLASEAVSGSIDFVDVPLHITFDLINEEEPRGENQEVGLNFQYKAENDRFRFALQNKTELLNENELHNDYVAAIFPNGYLSLPKQLLKDMKNYTLGKAGYGSSIEGNFARMFYLSAITITTLGFGDIVPLTSTSRILISVESVLGIVIIGLFLNSLSYEKSKIEEELRLEKEKSIYKYNQINETEATKKRNTRKKTVD